MRRLTERLWPIAIRWEIHTLSTQVWAFNNDAKATLRGSPLRVRISYPVSSNSP